MKIKTKMAAAAKQEKSTKEMIGEILDDYEKMTKELFDSLCATSLYRVTTQDASSAESNKAISRLIEKDKELQVAVRKAQEQHSRQQEIESVKSEVARTDQDILNLESQLKEAEQTLAQALFQAKKKLSAVEQATKGCVSSEELIKYAHRISSSNAVEAPPSWMPGDPRRPYPQDIEMRVGLLGRLGEDVTGGSRTPSALAGMQETGALTANLGTSNGMAVDGIPNGQGGSLAWNTQMYTSANTMEHQPSALGLTSSDLVMDITNGNRESGVDEVEVMSSSSSSSSSDSP